MIKHVVMWTVSGSSEQEKKEIAGKIKQKLESLKGKIGGLLSIEVGINENKSQEAYDVCLISVHESREALQNYQDHPLHKEAGSYIGQVKKSRTVADFEM